MDDRLSAAGYKRLYALSGNECAFKDCGRPVTIEDHGVPVTTSEAAHIVGKSRQGPRGRVEIDDEERRGILNHVLFCDEHHKVVDNNPRIYSVGVLLKMKADHEAKVGHPPTEQLVYPTVEEAVRLTALSVIGMPSCIYSAEALHEDFSSTLHGLWRRHRRDGHDEITPFLQLEGKIWSFHDLKIFV